MRIQVLGLVVAVAFGFAPSFVNADDVKKDEKKAVEKKGGCCGDEEKAAEKKGGCCGDEEKAAKKDDGCEGCGKDEKTFAKAIVCKDCKNSEKGPCDKCVTALKEGKVTFVPVSGMTCGNCEGAVANKLEKIDGIKNYAVAHRFNGIAVFVEPGKTVKLSDIKKALGEGKFAIDETAKLAGQYTFQVDEKSVKTACETLCKLLGIECPIKAGKDACCSTLTFNLTGKDLTLKAIKDKLAESKIELKEIEIHGPAATAGTGKS